MIRLPALLFAFDPNGFLDWLRAVTPVEIKAYYWSALDIYTNPALYAGVGVILFLEHLRPAIQSQRLFSRGLLQDFLWFNLDAIFKVAALPAFVGALQLLYNRATGGFTLSGLFSWPFGVKMVIAFFVFDFSQWFHHWVRHRVHVFWHFHVIHHSQREMNLFTDLRVHAVEYLVAQSITFVPLFMLGLTPYSIMGFGLFQTFYTRLIHANIRTNFGPLRFVLVTPQAHRVHHSIERRHQDKNFGVTLIIWDRLFGTLYPHYDEYPPTGLEGVDFPPPSKMSPRAWLRSFWAPLIYPFKRLLSRTTTTG